MKITKIQLLNIIKAEISRIHEGEVVDMFSGDEAAQNAVEAIARALANRAEKMLDADGDGDDVAVHVDHKLFLSPYADIDGHGGEVQALAVSVYEDYVSGKAGDQAESLDSIIERIGIDYFDEDIEYTLEALGDDRFRPPFLDQLRSDIDNTPGFDEKLKSMYGDNFTQDEIEQAARAAGYNMDRSQQSKTKEMAAMQDPDDVDAMEAEIEARMQGKLVDLFGDRGDEDEMNEARIAHHSPSPMKSIASQEVLDAIRASKGQAEEDELNEAAMVSLQPITPVTQEVPTQEDMWMRIAGITTENSEEDNS